MQIKEFLEQKNYSHLLGELEQHFTITPIINKEWSLLEAARKKYGKNAVILTGRRSSRFPDSQPIAVYNFACVLLVDGDGFGRTIFDEVSQNNEDDTARQFIKNLSPGMDYELLPIDLHIFFQNIKEKIRKL